MNLKPKSAKKLSTRDRLLNVTSELVAEYGFEGVSLRSITNAAGANVASVNYYFGGKDKLFEQLQILYIKPVNEERAARLDKLLAEGGEVSLEDILEAFIRPLVTQLSTNQVSEKVILKILARCLMIHNGTYPEAIAPYIDTTLATYKAALVSLLPELDDEQLVRRLNYAMGSMIQSLMHSGAQGAQCEQGSQISNSSYFDAQLNELIGFCAAGFRASI